MEDKAGQLSSVVGTGNCEDGMEDKASQLSSVVETGNYEDGMEDKSCQLSSVVGTGNCEDIRGNFSMKWRTRQANCSLLQGQETVRTCVETFLWNGGQGRPTVFCSRDRQLRVANPSSFPTEWRTMQANCPLFLGQDTARTFVEIFQWNGGQGRPTVLCCWDRTRVLSTVK